MRQKSVYTDVHAAGKVRTHSSSASYIEKLLAILHIKYRRDPLHRAKIRRDAYKVEDRTPLEQYVQGPDEDSLLPYRSQSNTTFHRRTGEHLHCIRDSWTLVLIGNLAAVYPIPVTSDLLARKPHLTPSLSLV